MIGEITRRQILRELQRRSPAEGWEIAAATGLEPEEIYEVLVAEEAAGRAEIIRETVAPRMTISKWRVVG